MYRRFYFDHNATTPISTAVLDVYSQALAEVFGNASSIHYHGQAARQKLEQARRELARLIGCTAKDLIFLSGGTEADNLAIFGTTRGHVITSSIEHPAVLNACAQLEREGVAVTYVGVGSSGVVNPDDVRRALRPDTRLISVMHVNNELGTVQPIAEIARLGREAGALVHSDGVQAVGRVPVNLGLLGVDLYSISGHKMYAPKGVGALYVRKGIEVKAMLYGGRHEGARRAGTENVPAAIALGSAASETAANFASEARRLQGLRDRLEQAILERIPDVSVNGTEPRSPNTTNLRFDGIEGEALVIALDLRGFCVSSGAACSSGAVEPSHVLTAIGQSKPQARSSIRFSLGRSNTEEQVDALVGAVTASVEHLRKLSPAYA